MQKTTSKSRRMKTMEKKAYEYPEMDIMEFGTEDIITTSESKDPDELPIIPRG